MKKKVLIVAYYWPPAGGPGVQRWLKFVKYLGEFDIEPIVYVPENPNYPLLDANFEKEVPEDIVVLKQPIFEPYAFANIFSRKKTKAFSKGVFNDKKPSVIAKLLLYIRGNFFIPDARKFWIKPSVKYLRKYLAEHDINTIITTGPPHSMHLIGMQLKKAIDIRWIADFRDPWTTIGYHSKLRLTKTSQQKHKQLEREVLTSADTIITTSYTTKVEFLNLTDKPIEVITNGFDAEKISEVVLDEKFTISHIGSLLVDRNPRVLWNVLAELCNENEGFSNDFQLQFAGTTSETILEELNQLGLQNHIKNFGYVSHQKALQLQHQSQVVVLIEIDAEKTKGIIAGKLFEYMNAKRPILALGPKDADIEKIITETNTGNYFLYHEAERLKAQILKHYEAYKSNSLHIVPNDLEKYSRKQLTQTLATLLHKKGKASQY